MTAVTEILTHCKKLISEGSQIDTQGLVHWIEDKLLDMEKQQMKMAQMHYSSDVVGFKTLLENQFEEWYNQTFKSK